MNAEEIRALSVDAIRSQLEDAREELMRLRFQQSTGELTDTSRLRVSRRNIARLNTILNEMAAKEEGEA